MAQLKPTKTVYTVSQFLDWQRNGILKLKPVFQRREVWDAKLKSLLIDTVVTGLPIPIVFLRQVQNLTDLKTTMEVIDGQQRLRTLLSFVDPSSLKDFDAKKDQFLVRPSHNADIANTPFAKLPSSVKSDILGYEISTHVFPSSTGDEEVLRIFARLNSTGARLKPQEIRNATFAGEFKTLSYRLAFENLERWRKWQVFSDKDIARMLEVETVSDFLIIMLMCKIEGKSQPRLDKVYAQYDDELPRADTLRLRFQKVLDAIDESVGQVLPGTRFCQQVLFYSLFAACYDHMYGIEKPVTRFARLRSLPKTLERKLVILSKMIDGRIFQDKDVLAAMSEGTAHQAVRLTRHNVVMTELGLSAYE